MATASKPAFDQNIQRAKYFLEIHQDAQQGAGAPPLKYRELPRAAIVFAVGAIDAYLSQVSAEVLIRKLQENLSSDDARSLLKRIQNDVPTLALEIAVLATNAQRATRMREVVVDHFHNHVSNHGAKAVAAAMRRIGREANDVLGSPSATGLCRSCGRP